MSGIPVVISTNGLGLAVRAVESGAPVMTVATNGHGAPIVLSERGVPFIVEGVAPGGPVNTLLPSFIQPNGSGGWEPADPVDNNPDVFLDAGTWSGGTPPYSFEFAVYNAADDSVLIARTSEGEIDLGTMTGLTIYGRVWCTDAAEAESFADTADFGPITAGFVPVVLVSLNYRNSNPTGTPADEPVSPATWTIPGDAYPTSRGGYTFGHSAGTVPGGGNRTSSSDPRLRGFQSMAGPTTRIRADLAGGYKGNIRLKFASGITNGAGACRLAIYDGNPDAGGVAIFDTSGGGDIAFASGQVVDTSMTAKALATWTADADAGTVYLDAVCTTGELYIRRAVTGTASTTYLNHLYVESRA